MGNEGGHIRDTLRSHLGCRRDLALAVEASGFWRGLEEEKGRNQVADG
jgi:hypothetical protein